MGQTRGITAAPPRRTRAGGGRPPGAQLAPRLNALHRGAVWFFACFAIAMLAAFWPSYYSRLSTLPSYHFHAHGVVLTAWVGLLVAQALLIRTGNRARHRTLGRLSFVLAPLVVAATVHFAHFQIQVVRQLDSLSLYFLTLVLGALAVFVVLFGLAMLFRRHPARHARFMLCTLFPFFPPVTDRLIAAHAPAIAEFVPRIDGSPILPFVGFALADLILVALCLWDWRANRRVDVFPLALIVLVLYHVAVFTFHELPAWAAFGRWFVALPLS